jgi:hypothetical protein
VTDGDARSVAAIICTTNVEGAQPIVSELHRRLCDEREFGIRKLRPYPDIVGGDFDIAKPKHISTRFSHLPNFVPIDLVQTRLFGQFVMLAQLRDDRIGHNLTPMNLGRLVSTDRGVPIPIVTLMNEY